MGALAPDLTVNGKHEVDITKVLLSKEFILFVLATLVLGWLSYDGLAYMSELWEKEEYSHGPIIPLVALFLFWQRRNTLFEVLEPGSWFGFLVLLGAICMWLLGELSALYTLVQYAFIFGLWGLAMIWFGVRGAAVIWASLFYLVFMIPLPNFLYANISQELQLISSALGVAVIRFFDISVFLEGNVIDLGVYQLQVVEACSGLRYLFPLMSFGFLIAYIYRGPLWQKLFLFISTVPITVLMNSFRIGVIGVTVEHFGIAAAEGFLHDFEGWIVFMACLGVLAFEIWIFYLFSGRKGDFGDLLDLDFGHADRGDTVRAVELKSSAWAGLIVLLAAIPLAQYFADREDVIPEREQFSELPLAFSGWRGNETTLTEAELEALKLTDYFIGNFSKVGARGDFVNFYTAWYEEQRKGASIHSPRSCLPGGGWVILEHTVEPLDSVPGYEGSLQVNRVVMQMGETRQLVYYWFEGRGRNITNEYMAKWYIFWDSLTRQRTDGALVRLITLVPEGSEISAAEHRLQDFLGALYPKLPAHIPN